MGMWVRQLFKHYFLPVLIFKSTFGQTITDSFDQLYGLPVLEILAKGKTFV